MLDLFARIDFLLQVVINDPKGTRRIEEALGSRTFKLHLAYSDPASSK